MNPCRRTLTVLLTAAMLASSVAPGRAEVPTAPGGTLPGHARPAPVDLELVSRTIQNRTLPNVWRQEGELTVARWILSDAGKRAHAVGHLAEEDFVIRNPSWRKTASANAPENDVWRWVGGRLEGGQIKTHADGDAAKYLRDMFRDSKAEWFIVPDDHLAPLLQKIEQQAGSANSVADENVAAIWQAQIRRAKPLGRTVGELNHGVVGWGRRTVAGKALSTAQGSVAVVLVADGALIGYRCSKGELTHVQVEEAVTEAVGKAGIVGLGTYGAVVLGASPVGITVVVIGVVVYVLADYVIDQVRPLYTSSPMTGSQIDEVMPIGWRRMQP